MIYANIKIQCKTLEQLQVKLMQVKQDLYQDKGDLSKVCALISHLEDKFGNAEYRVDLVGKKEANIIIYNPAAWPKEVKVRVIPHVPKKDRERLNEGKA